MRDRLAILLEKYYEGKTTLAEEKELRTLFLQTPGFEVEKQFFDGLESFRKLEPISRPAPIARGETHLWLWLKIAAVMVVFLGLTWLSVDHQNKKEEALAYAQVMEAFSLIQNNLQKGTASLEVMQDMKYLDKTNEIFNIKEKEEQ